MNLTEFSKEVHQNAVAHGWWDEDRSFEECVVLMHCEVSEAVEEYRNGKPMLYYECPSHDTRTTCPDKYDGCQHGKNKGCQQRKPEGIAVELIDCLIRILDWCGKEDIDVARMYLNCNHNTICNHNFIPIASKLHNLLCYSNINYSSYRYESLFYAIRLISGWLETQYVDWQEIMLIKHEYNKTRPYKHGGKKI